MCGFISLEPVLYISLSYALVDFGETGHLIEEPQCFGIVLKS